MTDCIRSNLTINKQRVKRKGEIVIKLFAKSSVAEFGMPLCFKQISIQNLEIENFLNFIKLSKFYFNEYLNGNSYA